MLHPHPSLVRENIERQEQQQQQQLLLGACLQLQPVAFPLLPPTNQVKNEEERCEYALLALPPIFFTSNLIPFLLFLISFDILCIKIFVRTITMYVGWRSRRLVAICLVKAPVVPDRPSCISKICFPAS